MRVIGLIGGMSWESTAEYYRILNEEVNRQRGGLHSARCVLGSVDFHEIESLQRRGAWKEACEILCGAGLRAEAAGAECLVLCTNTMHLVATQIEETVSIPFLHIADATGERIIDGGLGKVGLLGTHYTMEQEFYAGRLQKRHRVDVLVPCERDRQLVHDVIYDELCQGSILQESRDNIVTIINGLVEQGAEGIVLGCTEIPLLIREDDVSVPLFDTTRIHAEKAVAFSLG